MYLEMLLETSKAERHNTLMIENYDWKRLHMRFVRVIAIWSVRCSSIHQ